MTQICLLDPARLSQLLKDALSWRDLTSSLMVSAANGSILSYAFKGDTPGIKDLRTMSTTMTAAYTIASEDILVFEAQVTRALAVIIPVGDHVLLAVNGPARAPSPQAGTPLAHGMVNGEQVQTDQDEEENEDFHGAEIHQGTEEDSGREQIRQELEEVAEALADVLRQELSGMKWPGDI